jgi:uncharacterized protein (DUF488 family)
MSKIMPEHTGKEESSEPPDLVVYTVGHSTLPVEAFLELLRHFTIEQVVDVRTIPRSRHNPQYEKSYLSPFLRVRRIKYLHLKGLGGLRRHNKDSSANAGWRNASFRGYADYMQTPQFTVALNRLILIAGARRTVIMCAEAVPWRCHRSLIGDALLVRGIKVIDIFSKGVARPHDLTPMAVVDGIAITYPAQDEGEAGEAVEKLRS